MGLSKERGIEFQKKYDELEYKFANIELNKQLNKQKEVLDKIKEYIPKLRRTPSYELDEKLDDILELLEELK